ncbi:uncharacterized protein LOC106664851 [Cimex lectularius]|uniref:PDZ domain-containing protein n=1 Tax=Cimex lectularius TaxID=79782 RepID=A0A8I6RJN4_CIMLE|nr:uncharacterized protein LOC106664851 [Cimex lectularius]
MIKCGGNMTRMGSASHIGEVRRFSKGIRSSKKSILYSDYYDEDSKKDNNLANQRSISLGALHQGGTLEPRMAQLETLEAKMASIEVSLSTTPRRKKSGSTASTPVPPMPIAVPANNIANNLFINSPVETNGTIINPPAVNGHKDISRELDGLRIAAFKEKENVHCLKNGWSTLGRPVQNGLNDKERKAIQDKMLRLKSEQDSKRLAIKNIKIALDTIDISDNIDVRIQQAELEYQLGREELNLLSILEEIRNLQACLEENVVSLQTIFSYIGNSAVSLIGVELMYDAKSPQFGAGQREEGALYIEWAADGSGLCKGDRLLEVNGKLVVGKGKEDMCRLLSVSPSPAQIVVMRKHSQRPEQIMSHLQAELSVVKEKAGEAERTRDSFRSDNLRLTHRISYLEEQVAELLERARESKAAPMPQVFQKGNQVALVANLPGLDKSEQQLPSPRPKANDEVRSTKSVDVLIEKPKRKKDLSQERCTNSLNIDTGVPTRKHRHHHDRSTDHLHGEQRQKHIREARSSLFAFMDKKSSKYSDFDSESSYIRDVSSHNDCSSESSLRYYKKHDKIRPIPPKKPIRLSLHRATSLQSMDSEKKPLKRTHKGEAPPIPMSNGQMSNTVKSDQILQSNGHCISNHTSNSHSAHMNGHHHHIDGNWC